MGKKILVVSDNHGNWANLNVALEFMKGKMDALVHCGDSEFTPEMLRGMADCPVYLAEGNCDYYFAGDSEDIFELGGHVCFVTHGNQYGVNWGRMNCWIRHWKWGRILYFTDTPMCRPTMFMRRKA